MNLIYLLKNIVYNKLLLLNIELYLLKMCIVSFVQNILLKINQNIYSNKWTNKIRYF